MIQLTERPLDPGSIQELLDIPEGTGSVVVHFAVVKPFAEDKRTEGIRFTPAREPDAEMGALEAELRAKWELNDILLIRRIGDLKVGEVISVAAVAAPGRDTAFGACRDAVEGFKKMKSLQKEELFKT